MDPVVVVNGVQNQNEPDQTVVVSYVSTRTERLMFSWPIHNFLDRTAPIKTKDYHFMEENHVNDVQWKLEIVPKDNDDRSSEVVSAKLYLTYSGKDTTRGFKVNISISLKDCHGALVHNSSSSIYYLTREDTPDGSVPSYKTILSTRQELLDHRSSMVPDNILTVVVKMVFVQELSSAPPEVTSDEFLLPSTSLGRDMAEVTDASLTWTYRSHHHTTC